MSRYLKGRGFALKMVAAQLLTTVAISVLILIVNNQIAISLFVGGIICVAANLWLALVAFRPPLGASPQKALAAFYVGELGKFVITALLFLLAFKKIALFKHAPYAATMILAYVMVQAIAWLHPLLSSLGRRR